MGQKIDDLLDKLLTEIEKGRSLKDCLKDYPEFASELEPLLQLVIEIKNLPKPEPRPETLARSIQKALAVPKSKPSSASVFRIFSPLPPIVRIAAVVLFVVLIGWSSLALSRQSIPGDVLYPIKTLTEKVQYLFTFDSERKVTLHLIFANERTKELLLCARRKNRVNKELLNAMLNETSTALKLAGPVSFADAGNLIKAIQRVNQNQIKVLSEIRGCHCDNEIVKEALRLCAERECCIQYRSNPKLKEEYNIYSDSWNQYCNWR